MNNRFSDDLAFFALPGGLMGWHEDTTHVMKANDGTIHFTHEKVVGSFSREEIDAERVRLGFDPNDFRVKGDVMYVGPQEDK